MFGHNYRKRQNEVVKSLHGIFVGKCKGCCRDISAPNPASLVMGRGGGL